jgi:hypothetical protein
MEELAWESAVSKLSQRYCNATFVRHGASPPVYVHAVRQVACMTSMEFLPFVYCQSCIPLAKRYHVHIQKASERPSTSKEMIYTVLPRLGAGVAGTIIVNTYLIESQEKTPALTPQTIP